MDQIINNAAKTTHEIKFGPATVRNMRENMIEKKMAK